MRMDSFKLPNGTKIDRRDLTRLKFPIEKNLFMKDLLSSSPLVTKLPENLLLRYFMDDSYISDILCPQIHINYSLSMGDVVVYHDIAKNIQKISQKMGLDVYSDGDHKNYTISGYIDSKREKLSLDYYLLLEVLHSKGGKNLFFQPETNERTPLRERRVRLDVLPSDQNNISPLISEIFTDYMQRLGLVYNRSQNQIYGFEELALTKGLDVYEKLSSELSIGGRSELYGYEIVPL
jgi:hypothetical protein